MPKKNGREPRGGDELPSTIERSEEHAQHIWTKAHDSAVETYGEGERAHRVAFAALKHVYRKEDDRWVRKARKGPSDEQAARGPTTRRKSTDEPRVRTAGGEVALLDRSREELYEEARRLGVKGRSRMNKEALAEAVQAARQA